MVEAKTQELLNWLDAEIKRAEGDIDVLTCIEKRGACPEANARHAHLTSDELRIKIVAKFKKVLCEVRLRWRVGSLLSIIQLLLQVTTRYVYRYNQIDWKGNAQISFQEFWGGCREEVVRWIFDNGVEISLGSEGNIRMNMR